MSKHGFIAILALALVGSSMVVDVARGQEISEYSSCELAINAAELVVEEARVAIERGKELVVQVPADSAMFSDIVQVLEAASGNWDVSVNSLKGAVASAAKASVVSNEDIAKDLELLAKVNADVASAGANVVKIGVAYIDAVANEKTEALDIITTAMAESVVASTQAQEAYGQVKVLVAAKYSK